MSLQKNRKLVPRIDRQVSRYYEKKYEGQPWPKIDYDAIAQRAGIRVNNLHALRVCEYIDERQLRTFHDIAMALDCNIDDLYEVQGASNGSGAG